jgi:hypothetical protein
MEKKVTRYMIRYRQNATNKRAILAPEFNTKKEAKDYIKKLLAPGKVNAYGIRMTAYRDTLPFGANNPRIIKREVYR